MGSSSLPVAARLFVRSEKRADTPVSHPRYPYLPLHRTFPAVCLFANAIVIAPFRKGLKIAS